MMHVGVVLTSSLKRESSVAVLDGERAETVTTFFTDDEILLLVQEHEPGVIAIASPLSLPRGLDCLDEACNCSPENQKKGREAERELSQMQISIFVTDKKSIIKPLINRGINLKGQLVELSWDVIEVNSQANKIMLFGEGMPKRETGNHAQALFLTEQLPRFVNNLEPHINNLSGNAKACEAVIAAHMASLYSQGEADSLGDLEEGMIIVPQLLR